jgi:tetratricopeptide (TPR) repeat protein
MFKNLADSYFSIGMYDKAVSNYEKALKMNQNNY